MSFCRYKGTTFAWVLKLKKYFTVLIEEMKLFYLIYLACIQQIFTQHDYIVTSSVRNEWLWHFFIYILSINSNKEVVGNHVFKILTISYLYSRKMSSNNNNDNNSGTL